MKIEWVTEAAVTVIPAFEAHRTKMILKIALSYLKISPSFQNITPRYHLESFQKEAH